MPSLLIAAIVLLFPALVLTAALSDILTFRIPNWISLALLAIFPVAALAIGMSWQAMGVGLAVGVGALVIGMILWSMRWIGGGDAKLFAAVALWMGWSGAALLVVGATLTGGVLAFFVLSLRSDPLRPLVALGPSWLHKLAEPGHGIPYGVAIAAGALFAFRESPFGAALGLLS